LNRVSRGTHNFVVVVQNGFAESFHARLRDEFLDREAFRSVLEAQVRLGLWRRYYKEERLHTGLEYQTPNEFASKWTGQAGQAGKDRAEARRLLDLPKGADHGRHGSGSRVRKDERSTASAREWRELFPRACGAAG